MPAQDVGGHRAAHVAPPRHSSGAATADGRFGRQAAHPTAVDGARELVSRQHHASVTPCAGHLLQRPSPTVSCFALFPSAAPICPRVACGDLTPWTVRIRSWQTVEPVYTASRGTCVAPRNAGAGFLLPGGLKGRPLNTRNVTAGVTRVNRVRVSWTKENQTALTSRSLGK